MNIVSPSILSADFANLSSGIASVSNAPWLHIDVMDGHFVPNITVGLPVVQSLRHATTRFLDVHLMISDPLFFARHFAAAGADLVCFHAEACDHPEEVISQIRDSGKKAAVALKPATGAKCLLPYLDKLDMVLIMTVEPGFGGQAFLPEMLPKIQEVKAMADKKNPSLLIEVDGGINERTAALCRKAGADILVAGSYVFGAEDPSAAVERLRLA